MHRKCPVVATITTSSNGVVVKISPNVDWMFSIIISIVIFFLVCFPLNMVPLLYPAAQWFFTNRYIAGKSQTIIEKVREVSKRR